MVAAHTGASMHLLASPGCSRFVGPLVLDDLCLLEGGVLDECLGQQIIVNLVTEVAHKDLYTRYEGSKVLTMSCKHAGFHAGLSWMHLATCALSTKVHMNMHVAIRC